MTTDPLLAQLARIDPVLRIGRVAEAYGTLVRATGIRARIGELCELHDPLNGQRLQAEVVGVSQAHTLLTPLGALDGLNTQTAVRAIGGAATVAVGDSLLGRIVDAHGEPIDGGAPLQLARRVPIYRDAPNPLVRRPVQSALPTGVRALDAMLTVGEGQRLGIFATAGGGKSTLLGMLARGTAAEVNVIVLVGERGREVREFVDDALGPAGLARSVVVVATSDRPALERSRAACVGTAIAEHFRDQNRRVLLLMDSVTRYARALRDVGLAVGEPPVRGGFPPSVFSALPKLFERAGNDAGGSITAFYTVLLEDEEAGADPVGEEVRSILDGHVLLSRRLAQAAHYPAIDVLASASRVMPRVASKRHQQAAARLRRVLAKYAEIELLIQIGEYKSGSDAEADEAVQKIAAVRELLRQPPQQLERFDATLARLESLL
jgi:type III secretion protein N (ATPase)